MAARARLAFGILLALGLVDLAVLNLRLAPQLAVEEPVRPTATVAVTAPPHVSTTVASRPSATAPPTTPVVAPPVATTAAPVATTTGSVAVVTPPPTTTAPPPVASAGGEAIPDILFAFDSQWFNPSAVPDLRKLSSDLAHDPSKRVVVRGHSDMMGMPLYKKELSQRRADTVKNYLISHGAPPDHVSTEAVGDSEPADTSSNPTAWAKNRRVQVIWR